jgi:hypothetical protein
LNTFLEILVHRGDDLLPIGKFDRLLKRLLKLGDEDASTKLSAREGKRRVSSAAVLIAVALRNFSLKQNHYATITAWTIFVAYTIGACARHGLNYDSTAESAVTIAKETIFDALSCLCEEIKANPKLLTPGLEISPIYMGRATLVFALMSLYWLWSRERSWPVLEHKAFLDTWLPKDHSQSYLWGEGAVPQYLAQYWYFSSVDPTWKSEGQLGSLLFAIIRMNRDHPGNLFPSPYFSFEDFLKHLLRGFLQTGDDPLRHETAQGMSFMAEGVMHLFIRTNLKQTAKRLWPEFTKLAVKRYEIVEPWQFCLYRTDHGKEIMAIPAATMHWDDLVNEARECRVTSAPRALVKEKWILALYVIVLPHRATPEIVRYLGRQFGTVWFIPSAIEHDEGPRAQLAENSASGG